MSIGGILSKEIYIKQAVILAGGVGARLRPLTNEIPKPMLCFHGRPFLEYLIELLQENGIKEIILLLGYLPEKIRNYFGDGRQFGAKIKYSVQGIDCETGSRIKGCEHPLDDHFLLLYCDNYWPLPLKKLLEFYNQDQTLGVVTIYRNREGMTQNNVFIDANGFVTKYDKSRQDKDLNGVEIGFFIFNKKILEMMPENNFSLETEIFHLLIERRQFRGYFTDHPYYSIGKPERLPLTEKFLQPKRVIFLDRDGVINEKAPEGDYVKSWAEFKFLPGAIEAIRLLTDHQYDVYLITNQAGIARGKMTEADLHCIHENMQKELARHHTQIKRIYYCPHGRDAGCECRKPKPGLLFQAAREHHIDLTRIFFLGDDARDVEAGEAAGAKTVLVTPERSLLKVVRSLTDNSYE